MDINFKALFWYYGILGGLVGIISAGVLLVILKFFEAHWK